MKRPSYKAAIEWIAYNDEPLSEPHEMVNLVSVVMIADLFDVPAEKIAADIHKKRLKDKIIDKE